MPIPTFLTEQFVETKNPKLNAIFNEAIAEVFSPSFYKKIMTKIKGKIQVGEEEMPENLLAKNIGNSITVNSNTFWNKPKELQAKTLIHEFIHVLQNQKNFFVFSAFPEINNLTKILKSIIMKYKTSKFIGYFLIGKDREVIGEEKDDEIIPYFINSQLRWDGITPAGRKLLIEAMRQSGIFNLESNFWKQQLKL